MSRWGPTAIVVALLAATALAFALTEREKLEKTDFAVVRIDERFSPSCRCAMRGAEIALRFRRTHVLTVQILGANDRVVRTLAREAVVHKGPVVVRWDGRNGSGGVVPDGDYTPRFVLDDGRVFDPPSPIAVDATPPRVTSASYSARLLRRRPRARIRIRYSLSEEAHPLLYANGRLVLRGGGKKTAGALDWRGKRLGRRLRPGRYRLQLAAVDLAGNVGERTRPFVVRLR